MAELTDLFFDATESAGELAARIRDHQASVGQRVGAPDPRPLFTAAPDGAIVDRAGRTLRAAPQGITQK
jgi:hypothetical protein